MSGGAGPLLRPEPRAAGPIVTGFSRAGFRVGDTLYSGGLWLTPEAAAAWDAPELRALSADLFAPLLALSPPPEFLLLGTGEATRQPPPALGAALEAQGIGLEPMSSRAAARAWGLLRGEGRWIAAALMPIGATQ
jgi:uncharacterized protein